MMFSEKCLRQAAVFAGGILFGTAGLKILASSDAKKCYIGCLAAGLRAKDSVMTTASAIQENAEDILEEAKEVNRKRAEKEVFEDESEEDADEETDEV
ncbi:MAG: DUF6110 family protein [Clostridiales bacterium]|nr:DUF6110 family protein [Clostridiales bacterium]